MADDSIKTFSKTEICVYSKDFRLLRYKKKVSLEKLARKMQAKGWGYHAVKIHRLERQRCFCLDPAEFMDLLSCLGETVPEIK